MEGKSHRVGGALAALGGYYLLKQNGYLIEGVTPILQLAIIYPFSVVGALMPDQDHHVESAPLQDPISLVFCKFLHLTTDTRKKMLENGVSKSNRLYKMLGLLDSKHRSWQTHSDLTFTLFCWWLWGVTASNGLLTAQGVILKLVATGLVLGLMSHLILDALTPSGIWSLVFVSFNHIIGKKVLPEKVRFVPSTHFFATGGKWEEGWRFGMTVVSMLVFLYILYDMLPYQIFITN